MANETFVTAVQPKPMDAAHSVENIQKMLQLLREHPGWTRKELVEHMQPGLAPDSPEAAELTQPLRWLVEKGHVIEFFNGTLSLPAAAPAQPPARDAAPKSARPAPAAPAVETVPVAAEAAPVETAGTVAPDAVEPPPAVAVEVAEPVTAPAVEPIAEPAVPPPAAETEAGPAV